MKIWRILAVLCMIGALLLTFAACGTSGQPSTEPSTEATDATDEVPGPVLADPAEFKDFIGTWYADGSSASYRLVIKEDASWELLNPTQETVLSGTVMVVDKNAHLTLNDPDGSQALDVKLDEGGKIYMEVFVESLIDVLNTNYFFNTITNDEVDVTPVGEGDVVDISPTEEPID